MKEQLTLITPLDDPYEPDLAWRLSGDSLSLSVLYVLERALPWIQFFFTWILLALETCVYSAVEQC